MKNYYAINYLNRGNFTRLPYKGLVFSSLISAIKKAQNFSPKTKKHMKVARLTLQTVEQ